MTYAAWSASRPVSGSGAVGRRRAASSTSTTGVAAARPSGSRSAAVDQDADRCRVGDDVLQPRRRRVDVQRDVGAAGLDDGEQRDDQVDRSWQRDRHPGLGPHARVRPASRRPPTARASSSA